MRLLLLSFLVSITACTVNTGFLKRLPEGQPSPTTVDVFFATSRQLDELPFGSLRSRSLYYGLAQVSVPKAHKTGQIEWPRGQADAEKHFLLASTEAFPSDLAMRAKINERLRKRAPGDRDIAVFIHGFNTDFGEGLYRMAQMVHDLDVPAIALHYSWPSAGQPLGYAYDRDSALFARRGLRHLVKELAKTEAENIILVAHSLGSLVTMEALQQMALAGETVSISRLGGVLLMSPDLDVDVFRNQADAIGPLPEPFVIFSSQRDRALRLIERLTTTGNRLGKLSDVSVLANYNVTYVDVTAFSEGGNNHFPAAKSPALIKLLSTLPAFDLALSTDQSGSTGLLPGTVLTIQNTTGLIVRPIR